ncbi:MAG: DUF1214 domain-containing protein [Pseudomonadota bacterium]
MTASDFGGGAWRQFCDGLLGAGAHILDDDFARTDFERAEGLRYLTRLTRIALEMNLENADPAFPAFYQASHETAKIGADNPDNVYLNATISGGFKYRISGTRGDAPIFSIGTKANRYAIDGTMASTGELDGRDIQFSPEGDFEVIVAKEREGTNWLPLAEDSSMLLLRQTFFDRPHSTPAQVQVECLNGPTKQAPLTPDSLSKSLNAVPAFVSGTAQTFKTWATSFRTNNFNRLNTVDQTLFFRAGGDPSIYYLHGWWELKEGEALRIRATPPACEGWNFQLNNIWMESLDYRHASVHTNNELAAYNDDGSVTVVVSPEDIGAENWLNTGAHRRGTMLWRWTGADEHPIPETEIISAP